MKRPSLLLACALALPLTTQEPERVRPRPLHVDLDSTFAEVSKRLERILDPEPLPGEPASLWPWLFGSLLAIGAVGALRYLGRPVEEAVPATAPRRPQPDPLLPVADGGPAREVLTLPAPLPEEAEVRLRRALEDPRVLVQPAPELHPRGDEVLLVFWLSPDAGREDRIALTAALLAAVDGS